MEASSPGDDRIKRLQSDYLKKVMPRLLRFAVYRCGNHHEAEDTCQEALIRVLKSWRHWQDGETPPYQYVKTTWERVFISRWRRASRRPREVLVSEDSMPEPVPFPRISNDEFVDRRVREAVERLPKRHRQVIKAVYQKGLTLEEVAEKLGLAIGTVHNYHSQAMAELQKMLVPSELVGTNTSEEGQDGR
jgi:RNA polymerase sigma factor (sigma-70 family)